MPNFLSWRLSLDAVAALGAEGQLEGCGSETDGQESHVGIGKELPVIFFHLQLV